MKVIYIAGKYSGKTHDGTAYAEISRNILAAREYATKIWQAGAVCLCPHLNTSHFEIDCSDDAEMYYKGDLELLSRCDAVYLLPSWSISTGAVKEKLHADKIAMPVFYPEEFETLMLLIRDDVKFNSWLGKMRRIKLEVLNK